MNKPEPKVEISTTLENAIFNVIRIVCIGSDAHMFVKDLSCYGKLDNFGDEDNYKIYRLTVLDNYDVHEVNDYILSYND